MKTYDEPDEPDFPLAALVDVSARVAVTSKRSDKVALLAGFLAGLPTARGRTATSVLSGTQRFRAHALEAGDVLVHDLAAVEAQVVRAEARRERGQVQERLVEAGDLEQEASLRGVPVDGQEARLRPHAARVLRDRREGSFLGDEPGRRERRGGEQRGGEGESDGCPGAGVWGRADHGPLREAGGHGIPGYCEAGPTVGRRPS